MPLRDRVLVRRRPTRWTFTSPSVRPPCAQSWRHSSRFPSIQPLTQGKSVGEGESFAGRGRNCLDHERAPRRADHGDRRLSHRVPWRHRNAEQLPFPNATFDSAEEPFEAAGLREVASTRVLIAAGRLVGEGLSIRAAARAAVAGPLTDDPVVTAGLFEMIDAYLDDESV